MPYATQAGMIARFGLAELVQRTDRHDPPLDQLDEAVLNAAIERADAVVDSYLRARYALPLVTVPLAVAAVAEDVARRFLYDDGAPEGVASAYAEAIDWLEKVSRGSILLDPAAAQPAASGGAVGMPAFNGGRRDWVWVG